MKALNVIIAALVLPLIALNMLGGIVSGIWLAVLGMWKPIFAGLFGLFGSTFLLGLVLMPGLLLVIPASKLVERRHYFFGGILVFASSLYTYGLIAVWCIGVMWYFLHRAVIPHSTVPLLLWSYGVAIGPLSYMASKDDDNSGSGILVCSAALGFIASGLWVLFGSPTVLQGFIVIASVMALGMVTAFALAIWIMVEQRKNPPVS